MTITLNNRPEILDHETLTVSDLLKVKNFTFKLLVVKVNGKLVRKEDYSHTSIKDGDDVSVIHLISGG